ncbi:MAG: decarboxylase [Clostridiales bacterium]|nr:decarboxylase [Clostridiales bacterium]
MDKAAMSKALKTCRTPFYVFDTDAAAAQVQRIRTALGPEVRLCYAMKANSFIVEALQPHVDGFEVCSPGEFRICRRAHIPPEQIILSGVYKRPQDLLFVMQQYGTAVTYTVESLQQWDIIRSFADQHQTPLRVLLRLSVGNQFGINESDIDALVAGRQDTKAVIEGIQFFSGTQKKSAARTAEELQKLDDLLERLHRVYGYTANRLEYGPGLPVSYFEAKSDVELSMLNALSDQIAHLRFKGTVVLELGRYIAAACGNYFTRVVDTKTQSGSRYCIVDGGIHQVNYYGQMMAMKKPPLLHWEERDGEAVPWTVCGCLCTGNDVLVKAYPFSDLRVGDVLIFGKTGAYSSTESMALFLSRDLPEVALYSKSKGLRPVRRALSTDVFNSPMKL